MSSKSYLAIDIGAESGRLILGTINDGKLSLKEIHRFSNGMLNILGNYHWNIGNIYSEIIKGIEICTKIEQVTPCSIGIDTWGVDFGLTTSDGTILGLPFAYRDSRTQNAIEEFTEIIPKKHIYNLTGTQFAPYNTLFQLYATKKYQPEQIQSASDLLFMPDLLAFMLTGEKKTDFSFATTSQLYNPIKNNWDNQLFDALGISKDIMQQVVEPGTIIGNLHNAICSQTGIKSIPVIAVATHDTNSAIASIPATDNNWAYISSGTWSLMGIESSKPIINNNSYSMNFTNEGGVEHTFNILKNHMGLWLLQQCKKSWNQENYNYPTLVQMATNAKPFSAIIDIDHLSFLNPNNMPNAIQNYCKNTNQNIPDDHGQIARIIIESIALKYHETANQLIELSDNKLDEIIITGGGINNQLLCQFTANATNTKVKTALTEGSASGNILTQALGLGHLSSLKEMRTVVANSCRMNHYEPKENDMWNEAFMKYKNISEKNN
ncbi:MAG: rhamnulokinase [Marinilabiliaceae bacterium]|nr:rhamnulokinase [Marinilabiliaceae bacterium]